MPPVINNLTETRYNISECEKQIVLFNGYDRPRYYHTSHGVSGFLGIDDWADYRYKAVYTSEGTGSLVSSKYYSIKVVPMNMDITAGGFPIYGNATSPSIPQSPSGSGKSLNFTIPIHPQKKTDLCGTATSSGTGEVNDTSRAWSVDQWAGYTVLNVETGETDTVASNGAQKLTLSGTTAFAEDARYQIQSSQITGRMIYVAEMTNESDVSSASYYLQKIITDNTTTSYELTSFSETSVSPGDYFAPPNAFTCHVAGEQLFCAGGITVENEGTVQYNGTTESWDASADGAIEVSVIDDEYTDALISRILRFTASSAMFSRIYEGSYVTIATAEDSGNDGTDFEVLRVASDKTWFEILNNDGVANASDTTMVITMTPNIIEGTSTTFSEGMKDARFEFKDDNVGSYIIKWVDVTNQYLGLQSKYTGNNASATQFYKIRSTNNIYYSDYKNPHRYRSISLIEIGDDIKGLASIGRNLMVFCQNSLWTVNLLELGATPRLISDTIYFDATWSICSNGKVVLFYDGEGISATDGVEVRSLTGFTAKDYLTNINKDLAEQIQGIYNPTERRFEFAFPMGTETYNNYGLYLTEDSYNSMPYSRVDMNVLFTGYENGRFKVFHGTTGDLSDNTGDVWTHTGVNDGITGTAYESTITNVSGQVITVSSTEAVSWAVGDIVTYYPALTGTYIQMMIAGITDNSGGGTYEYELTFNSAYDLTSMLVGDAILYGMIPFDYGILWDDFTSPQYLKRLKALHFDLYGMTGKLYVDHYIELNGTTPVQTDVQTIIPTQSKVVVPFRAGKCYTYGFRIRGYSSTSFKINSFEQLFTPIT